MSVARYGVPLLFMATAVGYFFLYTKIIRMEKEIKEVEKKILRRLTQQLADQTNNIRDVIN